MEGPQSEQYVNDENADAEAKHVLTPEQVAELRAEYEASVNRKLQAIAPVIAEVFPGAFFNLVLALPAPAADGDEPPLLTTNITNMNPPMMIGIMSEVIKNAVAQAPEASNDA